MRNLARRCSAPHVVLTTLIWFPRKRLYLASGPYKPPPTDHIQALVYHGVKVEDQSRRDVIWFPHNTP